MVTDAVLHLIPPQGAVLLARAYGPLLARSLAAAGETDARACLMELVCGRRQMWGIFVPNAAGPVALFRTEIVVEGEDRWLCVSALAGRELRRWARLLGDGMAQVASEWGCKSVRFAGRPAWRRVLRDFMPIGTIDGETIYERAAL